MKLSDQLLATIAICNEGHLVPHQHSNVSLHKTLYFIRGWLLGSGYDAPFPEKIRVGRNGPVVYELFSWADELNGGRGPQRRDPRDVPRELEQAAEYAPALDPKIECAVRSVVDLYGSRFSLNLQQLAARDWCVRETPAGRDIDDAALRQRFAELQWTHDLYQAVVTDGHRMPSSPVLPQSSAQEAPATTENLAPAADTPDTRRGVPLSSGHLYMINDQVTAILGDLGWQATSESDYDALNELVHDLGSTLTTFLEKNTSTGESTTTERPPHGIQH